MTNNLFDTRGGVAMIGHCEACDEPIADDSVTGMCPECLGRCEGDEDDE